MRAFAVGTCPKAGLLFRSQSAVAAHPPEKEPCYQGLSRGSLGRPARSGRVV